MVLRPCASGWFGRRSFGPVPTVITGTRLPRQTGLFTVLGAAGSGPIAYERSPVEASARAIRSIANPNSGGSFPTALQTAAGSIPRQLWASTLRKPEIALHGTAGPVALSDRLGRCVDSAGVCGLRTTASCTKRES